MTIRKRPMSHYAPLARYTAEELAAASRADEEADRRWEVEAPQREAATRAESLRRASLSWPASISFPVPRGKIALYKGWEIEHDKHGWCIHYPDDSGRPTSSGKYVSTLRDAKRYIDNY